MSAVSFAVAQTAPLFPLDRLVAPESRPDTRLALDRRSDASLTVGVGTGNLTPPSVVPQVLSPSSVNRFVHDCQVKWYYRSVLKYPETRGSALGIGTAVDAAISANFRQKIETKRDLPLEEVAAEFRAAWKDELDTICLDKDEKPSELQEMGEVMTRVYMEQAAPRIQPAKVQHQLEGTIGGIPVTGYVDAIDVNGTVIDIKTAAKKPSGARPSASQLIQISTYTALDETASGWARIDTITKTKTVALAQQTVKIGRAELEQTARLYSIAADAMASGLYIPNRNSMLCSRKYCSFCDICEAEYGGKVE